jgi:hypothetical protein
MVVEFVRQEEEEDASSGTNSPNLHKQLRRFLTVNLFHVNKNQARRNNGHGRAVQ